MIAQLDAGRGYGSVEYLLCCRSTKRVRKNCDYSGWV